MKLVTAVEEYYRDIPLPRSTESLLTEICSSAAGGETVNGIARRLGLDVLEVRDVLRKNRELANDKQT